MKICGLTLSNAWLSTHLNELAFLMGFQRMRGLLVNVKGDPEKEPEQQRKEFLFVDDASQPKACSQSME